MVTHTIHDEYEKVNCCRYHTDVVKGAIDGHDAMRLALTDLCTTSDTLSEYAKELVRGGFVVPAIKAHRVRTGDGLREAKAIVDAYRTEADPHWECERKLKEANQSADGYRDAYNEMRRQYDEHRMPSDILTLSETITRETGNFDWEWRSDLIDLLIATVKYEAARAKAGEREVTLEQARSELRGEIRVRNA